MHPLDVEGPLDTWLAELGERLLVSHFLRRAPNSKVAGFYRCTRPGVVAAAAELPPSRSGATLEDAVGDL